MFFKKKERKPVILECELCGDTFTFEEFTYYPLTYRMCPKCYDLSNIEIDRDAEDLIEHKDEFLVEEFKKIRDKILEKHRIFKNSEIKRLKNLIK